MNNHRRFFTKHLLLFLVPILIAICMLSVLSFESIERYKNVEIAQNNTSIFNQLDNITAILANDVTALGISFNNSETLYRLEEVLRTQSMTRESKLLIEALQSQIDVPVYAHSYIESIYVYVENNQQQFLISGEGLKKITDYYDQTWYKPKDEYESNYGLWTEKREITRYFFEQPTKIITVYKPIRSTLLNQNNGLIVVNLREQYFVQQLNRIKNDTPYFLYVLDEHDDIILDKSSEEFSVEDQSMLSAEQLPATIKLNDQRYYTAKQESSIIPVWKYIVLTPEQDILQISSSFKKYAQITIVFSVLLALILALWMTRRSSEHVRMMLKIIKSAELGKEMPMLKKVKRTSEYNYILQSIIKRFVEQHYLQMQLSEKKYRLQVMELLALQSQINPHFLFNTLETINWKIIGVSGRPTEANEMIEHLSDLLRYSLESPMQMTTLYEEIEASNNYIHIQKVRYFEKFDVIWEYEKDEVADIFVPRLLLQPLIENSLYHGIKEKIGAGAIKIKIKKRRDRVTIRVIDNGVGIPAEKLALIHQKFNISEDWDEHIGLFNTRKRMMFNYKGHVEFKLKSKPNVGTLITIDFPLKGQRQYKELARSV